MPPMPTACIIELLYLTMGNTVEGVRWAPDSNFNCSRRPRAEHLSNAIRLLPTLTFELRPLTLFASRIMVVR
jgi:hypothetical protein